MRRPRFEELDYQPTPMGIVSLRRRTLPGTDEDVFEAKLNDEFLMSSLFTEAEEELSRMALERAPDRPLDVVVGGLGLGYTAATVLDDARVQELVVIDALAPVISWHHDGLVPLGRRLSEDPRCRLVHGDFFSIILGSDPADDVPEDARCDALVVDIDHSPRHLLHPRHAAFYTQDGIDRAAAWLRPGGVFALWSNDPPDEEYLARLDRAMPGAESHVVRFPDATGAPTATNTVYLAVAPAR